MHKLSLLQLEIVHAIVNEGSMTNAAQKLCLSQPALSHQLKDLEAKLDCTVFHRVNKKLVLTAIGKEVFHSAETVIAQMSQLSARVKRLKESDTSTIRVTTECYTCYHWLPEVIQKLKEDNTNIEIELVVEGTSDPIQYLLQGKVDLAIISKQVVPSPAISQELIEDEMVLLVPNSHRLNQLGEVTVEDLRDENLIVYDLPEQRNYVISHILNGNVNAVKSLQKVQLSEAIIELVSADLGVTIMAQWAANRFLDNKKLKALRFRQAKGRRQWCLASLTEVSPHEQIFIDTLVSVFPNETASQAIQKTPARNARLASAPLGVTLK